MTTPTDNKPIYRHDFKKSDPDPETLRQANEAPPWRVFSTKESVEGDFVTRKMDLDQIRRGQSYRVDREHALVVDAAIILRRPILLSGYPGVGKTSLAYALAWQLGLGNVLRWSITSRSTLKDSLYHYEAIGRLNDAALSKNDVSKGKSDPNDIGKYITLGPVGTAFLPNGDGPYHPRVLLIDEIDKCDIDLPNDLLHLMEEGQFDIPEISRMSHESDTVSVRTADGDAKPVNKSGVITCDDFPIVIMTTNEERDFSPAFTRRCIKLHLDLPDEQKLQDILSAHIKDKKLLALEETKKLVAEFTGRKSDPAMRISVDRLINAIHLLGAGRLATEADREGLVQAVLGTK